MTALSFAVADSATMLRRDLRHAVRFPMMSISTIIVPVLFLLLFAGVFGHTMQAGLGALPAGTRYIDYLLPGILLMTAASAAEATAVMVSTDMTEGIISRFRTMAISRASVLTGQVLGSLLRTLASGALVVLVAAAIGFRSPAGLVSWAGAVGVFALVALALTWLTVAFGLTAKSPAGANSMSLIAVVLPFISSAFVPASSMPAGVAWFARNQPFTPVIESLRGLLLGGPVAHALVLAVVWCLLIAGLGYVWARNRYDRSPVRAQ